MLFRSGTALQIGDLYFDTSPVDPVDYAMRTYTGSIWVVGYTDAYSRSESDYFHRRVPMKVKASEILLRGDVVKFSGYNQGEDAIEVIKTTAQTDICIGVVDTVMAIGDFGDIIIRGLIEGLDTSGQVETTIMYSAGLGLATITKPLIVYQAIAYIVKSHATIGAAMVNITEPVIRQNLGYTPAASQGTVTSPDGTDAILPAATITEAGLLTATDKVRLNAIEDSATADQTASEIETLYEGILDTNKFQDTEKTKVGHISVTQAVDLDTIESDTNINNTKETNVTTNLSNTPSDTAVTIESSDGTNTVVAAANDTRAGVMSKTTYDQHVLNNAKVSDINHNVTTDLSTSTSTTSVTVNSSDGTNATISEASGTAAGVMSTTHHDKLDGIEASANNYSLPTNVVLEADYATSTVGGSVKARWDGIDLYLTIDGSNA